MIERRNGDLEALESGLAAGGLVLHHGADGAPHHARGGTEMEGTKVGVGILPLLEDGHEEQLVADEAVRVREARGKTHRTTFVNTTVSVNNVRRKMP